MVRPLKVHRISDGILVDTRESHSCLSWRGKHNAVKSKILLQLYSAWSRGDNEGLCSAELVKLTGTSPASLLTLLPRWTRWQYMRVKAKLFNGRAVKSYVIGWRGRKFIEYWLPPSKRDQFIAEIKAARTNSQREVV